MDDANRYRDRSQQPVRALLHRRRATGGQSPAPRRPKRSLRRATRTPRSTMRRLPTARVRNRLATKGYQ